MYTDFLIVNTIMEQFKTVCYITILMTLNVSACTCYLLILMSPSNCNDFSNLFHCFYFL